jgi:hypothetical protein
LLPETVVDLRPPVPQKPLTASALALLELYYRLNTFVMATEEKAPVEWAAERFLGVCKTRAYAILLEIDACGDLESWFREKAPRAILSDMMAVSKFAGLEHHVTEFEEQLNDRAGITGFQG